MGTGLAAALSLGITYGPEVIEAVTDLIDRLKKGSVTQEEFDLEWAEMGRDWVATRAKWNAAGETQAAKDAES